MRKGASLALARQAARTRRPRPTTSGSGTISFAHTRGDAVGGEVLRAEHTFAVKG